MIFLLTKRSEKAMVAAWTIFQGIKRGCGTVPDCFVFDAIVTHHKNLTQTSPLPYTPTKVDEECLQYLFDRRRDQKDQIGGIMNLDGP